MLKWNRILHATQPEAIRRRHAMCQLFSVNLFLRATAYQTLLAADVARYGRWQMWHPAIKRVKTKTNRNRTQAAPQFGRMQEIFWEKGKGEFLSCVWKVVPILAFLASIQSIYLPASTSTIHTGTVVCYTTVQSYQLKKLVHSLRCLEDTLLTLCSLQTAWLVTLSTFKGT